MRPQQQKGKAAGRAALSAAKQGGDWKEKATKAAVDIAGQTKHGDKVKAAVEGVDYAQKIGRTIAGDGKAATDLTIKALRDLGKKFSDWRNGDEVIKNKGLWAGLLAMMLAPCCCFLGIPILAIVGISGMNSEVCNTSAAAKDLGPALAAAANGKPGLHFWPLQEGTYTISDHFGTRGGAHKGVDIAAPIGTPIYAAAPGIVVKAGPADGFGYWIVIDHQEGGQTFSTVYGHMDISSFKVSVGQPVIAGQHIADVHTRGESDGPHLHFEVWKGSRNTGAAVDPEAWLAGKNGDVPSAPAQKIAAGPRPAEAAPVQVAQGVPADPSQASIQAAIDSCGFGTPGANLKPGMVTGPHAKEFEKWIMAAVIKRERFDPAKCPGITAPLIAAQLKQEGGFNVNAHNNTSGADGPAQFMPATWNGGWGKDYDGDGQANTRSIGDAVMSQADFMCKLYTMAADRVRTGTYEGDPLDFALASYNCCGESMTKANRDEWPAETKDYVPKILASAREFATTDGNGIAATTPGGDAGQAVVNAALGVIGTRYSWGGGDITGKTVGISDNGGPGDQHGDYKTPGFDCSGLVLYAVHKATGRTMPRVAAAQRAQGRPIPLADAKAGDLVFNSDASHVGIYMGENQMIHAPQSGDKVKVSGLGDTNQAYTYNWGTTPDVSKKS